MWKALPAGLAALLCGCNPQTTSEGRPSAPAQPAAILYAAAELRDLTPAEKATLGRALAKGLKDPDSARWQWLRFPRAPKSPSVTYCGMVNAKNSYGGYTGSAPFMGEIIVKDGKPVGGILGMAGSDKIANDIIHNECRKHGWDPYTAL